jgi:UDP-glucose:(heptosyl)LPS alpha-1,3-glucosyltransferase
MSIDGFAKTPRLRIGFVLDRFDPSKGGMEWALSELFRHLTERGHEVHLFASEWKEDPDLSLAIHTVRASGPRSRREVVFADEAVRAARAEECDVVVGMRHSPGVDVYYPHGGVFRYAWRQKIATYRPFWLRWGKGLAGFFTPKNLVFRHAERRVCRPDGAARILAVSRIVRDTFVSYFGAIAGRISVVYNGVDAERFRPASEGENLEDVRSAMGASAGETVFLFVGHNFRLKGLEWLLRAGGKLARERPDFRIAVLGRDDPRRYRRIARRAGVADRVRFLGEVPDPERYYRAAQVFVLPTFYDPCSLATLEAMASGLPFVTTRFNGAVTFTLDGRPPDEREGFILDRPQDVEGLAARMKVLCDPEKRSPMAVSVRKYAEYYPWAKAFAGVERVLVLAALDRHPGLADEREPLAAKKGASGAKPAAAAAGAEAGASGS